MRTTKHIAPSFASAPNVIRFTLSALLVLPSLGFGSLNVALAQTRGNTQTRGKMIRVQEDLPPVTPPSRGSVGAGGAVFTPTNRQVETATPLNVREAARQEALAPKKRGPAEIRSINAPKGDRPEHRPVPILLDGTQPVGVATVVSEDAPPPSATGPSAGPTKGFKGEFLSSTSIPPDTHGAVGTTHVVTVTNDRMRIQTREGVELSRVTINSFWAGSTVKGVAVTSAFDTKVYFDRFNSRFILVSSLNGPGINSGAGLAVTQTADPTGTWNRFTVASDPTATASAGHAIDYPSVGFNKNWIVIDENTFNYSGTAFTNYYGQQIFVFDKAAAYANTVGTVPLFEGTFATCLASATQETELGCGFTMAPAVTEDNTTNTEYLIEDWDSTAAQLRMSKFTGTASAPILTVATLFPQSALSWRFDAARIGTTGGYVPQRQQSANLTSGTRIMANDSRIQNAVLRAGSLWTAHTVMLAQTPTPAGVAVGGVANPDTHSAVQWWQINPTLETGTSNPASVLQRARIEDPTADNCHDGAAGTRTDPTCNSTALQKGQFYAYPNISVNQNNDVLIGFTQFSNLTYPNSAYSMRLSADPINTMRDPAIYRPGQANYNIGAGSGTGRQNRWGDYSAAQTDPVNDTDFWTVQEYAGTVRDFGIGLAGNWETWWANVKPTTAAPSLAGTLIINEFRLRGPQGVRDEYVELFNPGTTPVIVNTTDNSDGWALAYSTTAGVVSGVAVVPNGTVIPAKGHFLIVDNPDGATAPTLTYSLNTYPGKTALTAPFVRTADSDTGWSFDLADNGGLALFKTSTAANFNAANRLDSVGFSGVPAGVFKEGNGIPAMTTQPTTNFAFYRTVCPSNVPTYGSALGCSPGSGGQPKDSGANENDFVFVDINGTSPTAGIQRLGAPGPKNLDSPLDRNASIQVAFVDTTLGVNSSPNRVRDLTAGPAATSTFGTLSFRRRVTNFTGSPVTRLRFRIVDVTTFPAPAGFADLRAITSPDITVTSNDPVTCTAAALTAPCIVPVRG
ncbi:MAG: lamin tail domain-containing protein, partial [Pyrinomonadaceae bacterium]